MTAVLKIMKIMLICGTTECSLMHLIYKCCRSSNT